MSTDAELPQGSPIAVTRRFVAEMETEYGRFGNLLLERIAAYIEEVPPQGRIYLDRLLAEEMGRE